MSRDNNILETVTIKISTNPIIEQYLEQLVKKGRHGKNPSEAAERLVSQKIDELIDENKLDEIRTK